uniref:CASPASE_P20 domain-containing protein n=1 Tax=Panagrellus redivivus TaxID=6233 RepID=A0A7E4UMJ5_PANRE
MGDGFTLTTNLTALPYALFHNLSRSLELSTLWLTLATDAGDPIFHLSPDDIDKIKTRDDPGAHYLRILGNRGQTVEKLLRRLHTLAKIHGPIMDRPQLLLHRKFCPVIWSRPEQIRVSIVADGTQLKLECKASGFPIPRYEWMESGQIMDCASGSSLLIKRCPCTARNVFNCRVYNFIEDQQPYTEFYKMPGKTHYSELISKVVNLSSYVLQSISSCDECKRNDVVRMYNIFNGKNDGNIPEVPAINNHDNSHDSNMDSTTAVVASDKVALIISNRTYAPNMSNLITPHCDAETLADILQQLKFKTVTMGDLGLEELKFIIKEYRKLLGDGVYAVFYFVGHGFEVNGQCYLLPIDAPADGFGPDHCVSMDWVLQLFGEYNPALNLIILDICRRFLPSNIDVFTRYAEQYRQKPKINRNTVYGYATSGGVGAYEIKGEPNGVFMKYLKNRITAQNPIIDVLNRVFRDIEKDKKVCDVQIPELRSNLTRPCSLFDPIVFEGHTNSYDHHTMQWRLMHELPDPVQLAFEEEKVRVTVWFDFCGHFTNKAYVFSSVGDLRRSADDEIFDDDAPPSEHAQSFAAYLKFAENLDAAKPKIFTDDEEGESLCIMLSNLQRAKGEVICEINLKKKDNLDAIVATKNVNLGHVLITRLFANVF